MAVLVQSDFFSRFLPNPENARRGEWDLALTGWLPDGGARAPAPGGGKAGAHARWEGVKARRRAGAHV
jgi:hypothetical protein